MKLKLQGPLLARAPSKVLEGALAIAYKCPEILQLIYERNLIEFFSSLTTILNIYMTLPITICESEKTSLNYQ